MVHSTFFLTCILISAMLNYVCMGMNPELMHRNFSNSLVALRKSPLSNNKPNSITKKDLGPCLLAQLLPEIRDLIAEYVQTESDQELVKRTRKEEQSDEIENKRMKVFYRTSPWEYFLYSHPFVNYHMRETVWVYDKHRKKNIELEKYAKEFKIFDRPELSFSYDGTTIIASPRSVNKVVTYQAHSMNKKEYNFSQNMCGKCEDVAISSAQGVHTFDIARIIKEKDKRFLWLNSSTKKDENRTIGLPFSWWYTMCRFNKPGTKVIVWNLVRDSYKIIVVNDPLPKKSLDTLLREMLICKNLSKQASGLGGKQ